MWPSDVICWHRSGSTLAQAMACCLMALILYLNHCRLISVQCISVLGSSQGHFMESAQDKMCLNVTFFIIATSPRGQWVNRVANINSLWPSDTIWRHNSGSTLAQVMACCLMAPSHYLNQCWLIISNVEWHSSEGKFTRNTSVINHRNYL